jgi:alkylmercury lyase
MGEKQRNLELIDSGTSADEQALRKAAFRAVLDGEAIDQVGLVATTGFAPEKVGTLLDGLTERGLVVVEPDSGRVVGSWGLSAVPTDHRLRIQGRDLYTWCALDAVGIPAGLGEDASIASYCHLCGAPVNVEMVAGQVAQAVPPDVRLWVMPNEVGRSVVGFT